MVRRIGLACRVAYARSGRPADDSAGIDQHTTRGTRLVHRRPERVAHLFRSEARIEFAQQRDDPGDMSGRERRAGDEIPARRRERRRDVAARCEQHVRIDVQRVVGRDPQDTRMRPRERRRIARIDSADDRSSAASQRLEDCARKLIDVALCSYE